MTESGGYVQIYVVGGAIRDELMGRAVTDRDYVVVGATPEALLAMGFRPIGKDFPVFLHPETHEEYALARTEKKNGRGYHGFSFYAAPDVSLEEDLARRDLTINAMARGEDGVLIDPFNGRADLEARVLRHVGAAFVEDPVRLLRLARFAARFGDFSLAPETMALMRRMVANGEIDHLTPERVWQEISRGLMEAAPQRMLLVLRACGALARLMPEVDALFQTPERTEFHPEGNTGAHTLLALAAAARMRLSLPARFATLAHDLGKALTPAGLLPRHHGHEERGDAPLTALCARLKVPAACRELARLAIRQHGKMHRVGGKEALTPGTMVRLLEACDLKRRPERFAELLRVCEADARGRTGQEDIAWPPREIWQKAAAAFCDVDGSVIAANLADKTQIADRLHMARVAAVRAALAVTPADS
ncbi:MAG: multifunctional CCA addition/repair protein [Zoogloeaceae bacterium]|jgi:tRNA nucleotidyltransferase (CCA-adding enzyme)|nr:multifunctional CCA addition/repair protein [Zoogloeaceae bacterium]